MKSRNFNTWKISFLLLILSLSFSLIFAGTITGQILTENNNPIPGSRVTLMNVTGMTDSLNNVVLADLISRHGNDDGNGQGGGNDHDGPISIFTISNPEGQYTFNNVEIGEYIVFAMKQGYQSAPYVDEDAEVTVIEVDADDQEVVGINIQLVLPPNPFGQGRVNGRVVNLQDSPLNNIPVRIVSIEDLETPLMHFMGMSNYNGFYMINRLPNGVYKTVAFDHMTNQILAYSNEFTITEDQPIVDSIYIVLDIQSYSVSGTVYNSDNTPAQMKMVKLFGVENNDGEGQMTPHHVMLHAMTNELGQYVINNVPNGSYRLRVQSNHGLPVFYPGTTDIQEAEVLTLTDASLENINVTIPALGNYTLSGIVKDAETELPIENITVTVDLFGNCHHPNMDSTFVGISVQTNAEGFYSIEVPFGFYTLAAMSQDNAYFTQYYDHTSNPFHARVIRAFHDYEDLNFDLIPMSDDSTYTISGTITENDGQPSAPVMVIAVSSDEDWEESVVTNQFGHYTIPVQNPGDYYIIALSPFAPPTYYQNALSWETAQLVTVNGQVENVNMNIVSATTNGINEVVGVINSADGSALSNVTVFVKNTEGNVVSFARTNEEGQYTMIDVPNEELQIVVSKMGYNSLTESVTIDGDNELNYTLDNVLANDDNTPQTAKAFKLNNYPNPFNPSTTISFNLTKDEVIALDIYNVKGQKVKTFLNEKMSQGIHNIVWDGKDNNGKDTASGIYFCKIKGESSQATHKMLLIK